MNPPDGRSKRWAGHREQRRAELVTSAIEAIRAHGPDLGMEAFAHHSGVSKPVLYRYFADKSQLWQAVSQEAAAMLVAAIAPAVAEVDAERELITAVIDAYLTYIENDPNVYRFVVHPSGISSGGLVSDVMDTVAGSLSRIIGDRLRDVGLDTGPALPWAHGIVGYVQSAGDWWLRHQQPISRPALSDYLTTLLWGGVSAIRSAADLPGGLAAR
jgi:AcrR family transcriptional regulator